MSLRTLLKLALLFLTSALLLMAAQPAFSRVESSDIGGNPARKGGVVGRRYSQGDSAPAQGRSAAAKYMGAKGSDDASENENLGVSNRVSRAPSSGTDAEHYLALHIGSYLSDDAYHWGGSARQKDVGGLNVGLTYRMGEWVNAADFALRFDVSTFKLASGNATKLSFLPMILFPDASSRFPLYFGGGIGVGIMAKQLQDESTLTFDYQLLLGARFFDVFPSTGFFVEAGVKNHLHLLSDGQFNGAFIAVGSVFTF